MKKTQLLRASVALLAAAFSGANLSADVVETKSGARIVGKVSKIDGGSVVVSTDYAGAITIKQSEVTSITTDAPVAVRLASGTRIDGKIYKFLFGVPPPAHTLAPEQGLVPPNYNWQQQQSAPGHLGWLTAAAVFAYYHNN